VLGVHPGHVERIGSHDGTDQGRRPHELHTM
jgi:hypothetical protein